MNKRKLRTIRRKVDTGPNLFAYAGLLNGLDSYSYTTDGNLNTFLTLYGNNGQGFSVPMSYVSEDDKNKETELPWDGKIFSDKAEKTLKGVDAALASYNSAKSKKINFLSANLQTLTGKLSLIGLGVDTMCNAADAIANMTKKKRPMLENVGLMAYGGNLFDAGGSTGGSSAGSAIGSAASASGKMDAISGAVSTASALAANAVLQALTESSADLYKGLSASSAGTLYQKNMSYDDILNQYSNLKQYNYTTPSDFRSNSWFQDVVNGFSAGNQGALAGYNIGGGWGAAIGGTIGTLSSVVGTLIGRSKAKKKSAEANKFIGFTNRYNNNMVANNAATARTENYLNALNNYAAFGGQFDTLDMGPIEYSLANLYLNNYANAHSNSPYTNYGILPNINAFGGDVMGNGSDFPTGLTHINTGDTHENNPYEGVQVGVDPQGTPNLVEENEVIYNDYVFSLRLKVPEQTPKKGEKLTKDQKVLNRYKNLSYADAAKKAEKNTGVDERPNDKIAKQGFEDILEILALSLEKERAKQQLRDLEEAIDNMSPEELLQYLALQNGLLSQEGNLIKRDEKGRTPEQVKREQQLLAQKQAQQLAQQQQMALLQGLPSPEETQQGIPPLGDMPPQGMPPLGAPLMAAYGGRFYANGGQLITPEQLLAMQAMQTLESAPMEEESAEDVPVKGNPAELDVEPTDTPLAEETPLEELFDTGTPAEEMSTTLLNTTIDLIYLYAREHGMKELAKRARKAKRSSREDKEDFVDEAIEEIQMNLELEAKQQNQEEELSAQEVPEEEMQEAPISDMALELAATQELLALGNGNAEMLPLQFANGGLTDLDNALDLFMLAAAELQPEVQEIYAQYLLLKLLGRSNEARLLALSVYNSLKLQLELTSLQAYLQQTDNQLFAFGGRVNRYDFGSWLKTNFGTENIDPTFKSYLLRIYENHAEDLVPLSEASNEGMENLWEYILANKLNNSIFSNITPLQWLTIYNNYNASAGAPSMSSITATVDLQSAQEKAREIAAANSKVVKTEVAEQLTEKERDARLKALNRVYKNRGITHPENLTGYAAEQYKKDLERILGSSVSDYKNMLNDQTLFINKVLKGKNNAMTLANYNSSAFVDYARNNWGALLLSRTDKGLSWDPGKFRGYTTINPKNVVKTLNGKIMLYNEGKEPWKLDSLVREAASDPEIRGYLERAGYYNIASISKKDLDLFGNQEALSNYYQTKLKEYMASKDVSGHLNEHGKKNYTYKEEDAGNYYLSGNLARAFVSQLEQSNDPKDLALARYIKHTWSDDFSTANADFNYANRKNGTGITESDAYKAWAKEHVQDKAHPNHGIDAYMGIDHVPIYKLGTGDAVTGNRYYYLDESLKDANGNPLRVYILKPDEDILKGAVADADTYDFNGITMRDYKVNPLTLNRTIIKLPDGNYYSIDSSKINPDDFKAMTKPEVGDDLSLFGNGLSGKTTLYTYTGKGYDNGTNNGNEDYYPFPTYLTWPGLVSLGLTGAALAHNIVAPKNYSNANALIDLAHNAGNYKPVTFNPIGNYLAYRPLDRNYEGNKVAQLANAERRLLANLSGGNRGLAMAGILASDYNLIGLRGELDRKAAETNRNLELIVANFNKDTDKFNSEGFLKADMSNQDAYSKAALMALTGSVLGYTMRLAIDDARANAINGNINSLVAGLNTYGLNKWLNELLGWSTYHNGYPGIYMKDLKSANGGNIRRKNRGINF